jgi:hypothetical protein
VFILGNAQSLRIHSDGSAEFVNVKACGPYSNHCFEVLRCCVNSGAEVLEFLHPQFFSVE